MPCSPGSLCHRATVVRDRGNGTVDVQWTLGLLGSESAKSKKEVRSLRRGDEVGALWLRVSRALGRHGAADLLPAKADKTLSQTRAVDSAGKMSHGGLMAWL